MAWASSQSGRSSSALTWDPGSNPRPGEGRPPRQWLDDFSLSLLSFLSLSLLLLLLSPFFLWSSFLSLSWPFLLLSFLSLSWPFLSSSWPFLSLSWWSKSLGSNRSPQLSHHSSQSP